MKNQALFSSIDKSKKLKCCLLFGALKVNRKFCINHGTFGDPLGTTVKVSYNPRYLKSQFSPLTIFSMIYLCSSAF